MDSRKGFAPTIMLIFFIFFTFMALVLLGALYYGFSQADTLLNGIDFTVGNVSFHTSYVATLEKGLSQTLNMFVLISIGLCVGQLLTMIGMGYMLSGKNKLIAIADIGIIIVAFIVAVIVSGIFNNYIHSSADLLSIYSNQLSLASRFVLNLPLIVTIVGGLIMLATYATVPRKTEPNILTYD